MGKYTPGPWVVDFEYRDKALVMANDRCVCEVMKDNDKPAQANARLISAAPDLLEACKQAKKYLEPDLVEPGRTVFWNLVAAIAKAEEEES